MKKINLFIAALAATVGLVSCNKNQPVEPINELEQSTGMLFVNLTPQNSLDTKATNTTMSDAESQIRSIQVFVFPAENNAALGLVKDNLETSKFVSGDAISSTISNVPTGNPIAITTFLGKKKIVALVNAPRQTNVTTLDNLLSRTSVLSENYVTATNAADGINRYGMVMAGAYGYTYTATASGNGINIVPGELDVTKVYDSKDAATTVTPASIPVYRLGARIEIGSVTVKFADTDLAGKQLTIQDIKLKNVMSAVTFGGSNTTLTGTAANWVMQMATTGASAGSYPADVNGASYADKLQDTGLAIACTEGAATPVNKSYIVYPNPIVEDVTSSTWAPRRTRLVIHATLDTENTYYVFSIADPINIVGGQDGQNGNFTSIVGNRRYVINNINITMKGKPNDNDDTVPVTARISAIVEVQDWAGQTLLSYEI